MKIVYNKNDEKEMKALMGFEPAHIVEKECIFYWRRLDLHVLSYK